MKKRNWLVTASAALFTLSLLTGCAATTAVEEKSQAEAMAPDDRQAAAKYAHEMGELMLKAMQENDYNTFMSPLRAEARERYTEPYFDAMREKLGRIVKTERITDLKNPMLYTSVWKVSCERDGTAEANQGKVFEYDFLFKLVVGKIDGEYKVFGFLFN